MFMACFINFFLQPKYKPDSFYSSAIANTALVEGGMSQAKCLEVGSSLDDGWQDGHDTNHFPIDQ